MSFISVAIVDHVSKLVQEIKAAGFSLKVDGERIELDRLDGSAVNIHTPPALPKPKPKPARKKKAEKPAETESESEPKRACLDCGKAMTGRPSKDGRCRPCRKIAAGK